jgi:hypothetical protein
MKLIVKKGKTSKRVVIFVQDSSSTTGAGLTGLTNASAGLVCYYWREDQGNVGATQLLLAAGTRGTWSSGGFVEKDAINMPGWYELGLADAILATGASWAGVHLKGATNMAPLPLEIQLADLDPDDVVRAGLTALPNVASGSAGAIPTTGTGANQISLASGQVILQAGVGAGQLDFTSGVVKANATQWLGSAIVAPNTVGIPLTDIVRLYGTPLATPATAGILDVNVKNWSNQTPPIPNAIGMPIVDITRIYGTPLATPAIAGVPKVDVVGWVGTDIVAVGATPNAPGHPLVDLARIRGTLVPIPVIPGVLEVNTLYVNGTVQTARDLGAQLDVAVSTRMAAASYTAPDNASITAIKAKTDSLTFSVAGKVDANILRVNGILVKGLGTAASPWGP